MSKANLLDTKTATFNELIGNGKSFEVPAYQRSYSWTQEQWEDLWSDLAEMRQRPQDRHYMGALVVEARTERERLIIDGQQRLTTLSILALAVIDCLQKLGGDDAERQSNLERAAELRRRFISDKKGAALLESSKLRLNEVNRGFYEDYLVRLRPPQNRRGLVKSNALLWECFEWYGQKLAALGLRGEELWSLLDETAGLQLLFILITVDDDLSAYTVFETLNARGLELSTTDLLKNYLFSRLRENSDLEALQRRWAKLIATVKEERFPDFLRYHLLCDSPKIRKERLFKLVRDKIKDSAAVFVLIDALESRAELFAAFEDSEHEFWTERIEARPYIREMKLFRVQQMTPILFAAWEKFSPENFVKVLRQICVITFRHTVIGQRNTNDLEPGYHRGAKAILTGKAQSPASLFEELKDLYVADADFKRDFEQCAMDTHGQRKKLVKYILCKLEGQASSLDIDAETNPASIEHLLPENPGTEWDGNFNRERQQAAVYRLGNLTLLEPSLNRDIGNGLFAEKKLSYSVSAYKLTQDLAGESWGDWTPALLEKRQKELAKLAARIWRVDYT